VCWSFGVAGLGWYPCSRLKPGLGWYPCSRLQHNTATPNTASACYTDTTPTQPHRTQLQPATRIPPQPSHTETPTHIETRTHEKCGDIIEESQAPDGGCINVRNMLSIEEVKKT